MNVSCDRFRKLERVARFFTAAASSQLPYQVRVVRRAHQSDRRAHFRATLSIALHENRARNRVTPDTHTTAMATHATALYTSTHMGQRPRPQAQGDAHTPNAADSARRASPASARAKTARAFHALPQVYSSLLKARKLRRASKQDADGREQPGGPPPLCVKASGSQRAARGVGET